MARVTAKNGQRGTTVVRPVSKRKVRPQQQTDSYEYPTADSPSRPEAGTQAQFKKKKPPVTYRYDSSLDPSLSWDEGNAEREKGEALLRDILEAPDLSAAKAAASQLKSMSAPFLNWAGKAERSSLKIPTLPLFVHERLSTEAIIDTLKGHRKNSNQLDLFGDPQRSIADQVLRAYEYRDEWVNRMILGDSLVVMNSLLQYEGMGGQVQMIYLDPPYGVRFGSNFQPFVRNRDVDHNNDDDLTFEPEMVQAYRDTWSLGTHSWLTYLRDRLTLIRELLAASGSVFVQINDEGVHHVREVMDEVFGPDNFVSQINFQTTSGFETSTIATVGDFLLWYAKDKSSVTVRKQYQEQAPVIGEGNARWILLPDGSYRGVTAAEKRGETPVPAGARLYSPGDLQSQGSATESQVWRYQGKSYEPNANSHWKANYPDGLNRLAAAGRIHVAKNSIRYRRFHDDFPYQQIGNFWTDTITGNFTDEKIYVVQTNSKVIERCILLTTDPGDLVFDPTCGSGTTAYVSEQWGRRWITADVSRVPLALARQRLLTATYLWYELRDESSGPAGGLVYSRRKNAKGEEIGGIVPHIKLENIANNEPPTEEILVNNPDSNDSIIRVCGPFAVEATIPTPMDWSDEMVAGGESSDDQTSYVDRMIEVLQKVKAIQLLRNRKVELRNVRIPAKTLSLSAEALVNPAQLDGATTARDATLVAIVFGPENGSVSERLVYEAAREAYAKSYAHLIVIGFGVEPNARLLIENCEKTMGVSASYVEATHDLLMGDLLKNMRSSQVFSVCGLPEAKVRKAKVQHSDGTTDSGYQVELIAVDVFDPISMSSESLPGIEVPAWFLDTDYNGRVFHVCQAFFPRTGAWEGVKKALKGQYEESVWDHLAGTVSAPFEGGDHGKIAVKVIDGRGNELVVTKNLSEAT